MFPLKDDNPTRRFPIWTVVLIAANAAVFVLEATLPPGERAVALRLLGLVPHRFVLGSLGWSALTLLTSQFLHGGVLHLAGNMLFLWIFGNNVEDYLGRVLFVPFYLACGAAAGMTQVFTHAQSAVPTIGASGAIAGVLGAYFVLFPRARVHTLIFLGLFISVIPIPAGLYLVLWFLLQVVFAVATGAAGSGTAWFAHIGGFLFGFLIILLAAPPHRSEGRWTGFNARSWLGMDA